MKKRKYTKSGLSPEQFVRLWQSANDIHDFVERSGMSKVSAYSRMSFYKKRGIKLRLFPGGRVPRLDIAELSKIAKASTK
jgi:hypothetical protein